MKNPSIIFTTILLVVACFAISPMAQAVSPAPDGGYPGGNTAEGQAALLSLTTGGFNTAVGFLSLRSNSIGNFNTAFGAGALLANTADENTAVGAGVLLSNTTGTDNTASGVDALVLNNTGSQNTATGFDALPTNTTGNYNTAIGAFALTGNTTGSANTAIGDGAGFNQTTGDGNVYIGNGIIGVGGETNHTYIRNIKDTTVNGGGADTVTVDLTTGLLGHLTSSRRYKEDIQPIDKASEALFALKPVSYRYKKEIDRTQSRAFGLIAEDVADVNPNLVACNTQGQPESVHYEMVNAMLLNEFLKEHRKVEEQEASISQLKSTAAKQEATISRLDVTVAKQETIGAEQQKEIKALATTVKEQAAQIQKVSGQLEASKPAPQVVNNP